MAVVGDQSPEQVIAVVAVEGDSEHMIAQAIRQAAAERQVTVPFKVAQFLSCMDNPIGATFTWFVQ